MDCLIAATRSLRAESNALTQAFAAILDEDDDWVGEANDVGVDFGRMYSKAAEAEFQDVQYRSAMDRARATATLSCALRPDDRAIWAAACRRNGHPAPPLTPRSWRNWSRS